MEAHSSIDLLNTTVPSSTTAEASSHADSSVHGTTTFGTTLHTHRGDTTLNVNTRGHAESLRARSEAEVENFDAAVRGGIRQSTNLVLPVTMRQQPLRLDGRGRPMMTRQAMAPLSIASSRQLPTSARTEGDRRTPQQWGVTTPIEIGSSATDRRRTNPLEGFGTARDVTTQIIEQSQSGPSARAHGTSFDRDIVRVLLGVGKTHDDVEIAPPYDARAQ